jgi:hypothetical protein
LTLGSGLFTAIGIAMILKAAPFGIFVTASFGVGTMIGVTMLLPVLVHCGLMETALR